MNLLPMVKSLNQEEGFFLLTGPLQIILSVSDEQLYKIAESFSNKISQHTGINPEILDKEIQNSHRKICFLLNGNTGDIESEEYQITCSPDRIELSGASLRALFYSTKTLEQIIMSDKSKIPCFTITDNSDFKHRGYYHDITRGKVPKLETLKALVDKLSFYKINELQLYVEHSFAFSQIPELWVNNDPVTADEIRELDEYCKVNYIDLIPSMATFGHLYELLRIKRFEHLNELNIKGSELPYDLWDRMAHYTIDPSNDDSFELIKSMIDEYLSLFSSSYFNICCDETFDLGKGKNLDKANDSGTGRLYVDFLKKIIEVVKSKGKIPMLWGDIVLMHPEYIHELPDGVIFLNWGYTAGVTDQSTATFKKHGVNQYVCPGVNGWSRFANEINIASVNIRKMIGFGKMHGAIGILNTDWGDCGHVNFLSNSFHGMIFGSSLSWNSNSYESDMHFDTAFSEIEWGDKSGTIGQLQRRLGSLCFYHFGNLYAWVNKLDCLWNKENVLKETDIAVLQENCSLARQIVSDIKKLGSNELCAKISFNEFLWSAEAVLWTIKLLIFKKVVEYNQVGMVVDNSEMLIIQAQELNTRFKEIWRIRNKESELKNISQVFKQVIEKLYSLS
jgi:hypothetical protein